MLSQKIVCYDCKVSGGTFSVHDGWTEDEVQRAQYFLMLHDGHRIGWISEDVDSFLMGFPVDPVMVKEWAKDGAEIYAPKWYE